jgi:hypothetical protein
MDTDLRLLAIYREHSDFVVVFLCARYEKKKWCGLEWRAIRELIVKRPESVLLVGFDQTRPRGLMSTDMPFQIAKRPTREVAQVILRRMEATGTKPR